MCHARFASCSLSRHLTSAAAGERVGFDIVNTTPGATYVVTLAGQTVASGTASGGNAAGSFTMPDLGTKGQSRVQVSAVVRHVDIGGPEAEADGEYPSYDFLAYTAPSTEASAPASQPTQPAPPRRPRRSRRRRRRRRARPTRLRSLHRAPAISPAAWSAGRHRPDEAPPQSAA